MRKLYGVRWRDEAGITERMVLVYASCLEELVDIIDSEESGEGAEYTLWKAPVAFEFTGGSRELSEIGESEGPPYEGSPYGVPAVGAVFDEEDSYGHRWKPVPGFDLVPVRGGAQIRLLCPHGDAGRCEFGGVSSAPAGAEASDG